MKTKTFKHRVFTNTFTFITKLRQKKRRRISKHTFTDVTHEVKPHLIVHWTDYFLILTTVLSLVNIIIYVYSSKDL